MYVVRMIEVATSLCDALRGVLIELDATGIFKDDSWKKITAPDEDALPPHPLRAAHRVLVRRRMHRNTELLSRRLESMRSRTALKFLHRIDRFETWLHVMKTEPAICRWPDKDRFPDKDRV